jgi:hypothetical protein
MKLISQFRSPFRSISVHDNCLRDLALLGAEKFATKPRLDVLALSSATSPLGTISQASTSKKHASVVIGMFSS